MSFPTETTLLGNCNRISFYGDIAESLNYFRNTGNNAYNTLCEHLRTGGKNEKLFTIKSRLIPEHEIQPDFTIT